MTIIEFFKKQLADEAIITRKMLAQIPNEKYDWQPHDKSMTIQTLANHIAELPLWIGMALNTDGLDFAANPYTSTKLNRTPELLKYFEESLEDAFQNLENATDDILDQRWVLRHGETILDDNTKEGTVRMAMSQLIHHRAQLGVFLRLLNVPIPGSYGPSADEQDFVTSNVTVS